MTVLYRLAALTVSVIAHVASAYAGSVQIELSATGDTVVVAKDATTDEILDQLSRQNQFELERIGELAHSRITTQSYSGDVRHILEQLLHSENHIVLISAKKQSVERVVVFGTNQPDTAPLLAAPMPPPAMTPAANPQRATVVTPATPPRPPNGNSAPNPTGLAGSPTKARAESKRSAPTLVRQISKGALAAQGRL